MADTVKRALDMVSRYQDPAHPKMEGFDWRPLPQVREDLEGLPEIPSHVEKFGDFMDETARRAMKQGLTPRDLIKAYVITRASIQRRAQTADKVRAAGLDLPLDMTGKIRPEGAMGEWLHSPMGQRYLDQAERGKVDEEAVAHAQKVMQPFGLTAETDALPWAVQHLGPHHKAVSDMVARALTGQSPPEEWRAFAKNVRGIGTAKAGFVASLLGRGDQPTLDARQVILNTGMKTKQAQSPLGRAGYAAVDRLAARQAALNPRMDAGLEPFRQHLTHHAIWDKAGNEVTTHDDVIKAMRNAKDGGRIGYSRGGSPHAQRLMQMLAQLDPATATKEMVRKALERSNTEGFTRTGADMMKSDPRLQENKPQLSDLKPTSKSAHLILPFEELEAQFSPKHNLMPSKELDIEQLKREKARLVPLVGDKTPADTLLTGVQGSRLQGFVNQQGGANYPRSEFGQGDDPSAWRSRLSAAKSMQNKVHELHDDERPVYGVHVSMGHKSGDSSHMLLHAAINHINGIQNGNRPISSEAIRAFDAQMREEKFPATAQFPMEWPGILNPDKVHDFFYNQPGKVKARPGKHVTQFVQNLDSVRWQKAGFPNVAALRFANTEPELLGEPQGAAGFSVTKLDSSTNRLQPNDNLLSHGTYTHGMPSLGYAGRFPALVQAKDIWRDHLGGAGDDPTKIQHTLMTKFPAVDVDDRVVDLVRGAQEERKRRYGFMHGGAVAAQPTDAQKKAGNYQKRHVSFQGLPVTIETAKGQHRSGTDDQGRKWSVKLPYDYGYIKRTEGADGDHVDVCIGPDHQSDHVFIIDQHDHRTGKFDEHKVMLGYRTRDEACRAYCAGFSDGKGPERQKAVVRMSMKEFKQWLKTCDTKKPVRGQGHIDRAIALASQYTSASSNPQGDRNGR
jgi:Inorganic Pyrophosphatase